MIVPVVSSRPGGRDERSSSGTIVPDEGRIMTVAQDVRRRRRELGLTQLDAAELAGVSERFVRLVESGKASVRLDKLELLLATLGLELRAVVRPT